MKRVMGFAGDLRFALLLLVCISGGASAQQMPMSASPEKLGISSQRLDRLTPTLGKYAEQGQLAGSVALVARKGKIVYLHAFGQRDLEASAPMRPDTIFRIASQSKGVIAVATMMLMEEGKLLLTDPVSKYIPEFKDSTVAVPRAGGGYDVIKARRAITIRDLLTHTSGISYGTGPAADAWSKAGIQGYYFSDRDEPIATTIARMGTLPFDAQPGEKWIYGYNFDILGVVVERASGQSLDQFLQGHIFAPLGMTDTAFYLPSGKQDRLAAVYGRGATGVVQRGPADGPSGQGAYVDGPRRSFSGGAGLLSTARDYGAFLQMLLNGGQLDGKRLLSRKTVELMTVDHLGAIAFRPGTGQGLGFSVVTDLGARGEPGSVGEFGWGGAYHSTYWVDPHEQLVVVYLTQLIPAGDIDDFGKLRALIYQSIVD
jgi:CubicO group peptidase (beta-lactamase class C family)